MKRWLTYMKERSPVAPLLLLGLGGALSGEAMGLHKPSAGPVGLVLLGIFLFLFLTRLMDERKDLEKDTVAHPTRPLPRGLIAVAEVERAIPLGTVALFALAGVFALVADWRAGVLYAISVAWLWLMYREFYVGEALGKMPMAYALSHQVVLFPLFGFAIAATSPEVALTPMAAAYCTGVLGAWMTYEIARKLDPNAHPLLKTYLSFYGPAKTTALLVVFPCVAAFGAWALGLGKLLWPIDALAALAALLVVIRPASFKVVEGVATLVLIAHLWSVFLAYEIGWWR
jgi:4-hydroxybenzoate polyprenyltransferase